MVKPKAIDPRATAIGRATAITQVVYYFSTNEKATLWSENVMLGNDKCLLG